MSPRWEPGHVMNTRWRQADPARPRAVQASVKLAEIHTGTHCCALVAFIKVQEQVSMVEAGKQDLKLIYNEDFSY